MALDDHLRILNNGAAGWNKWRKDNPKTEPNLTYAKLQGKNLQGYNLNGALLWYAEMQGADLTGAKLRGASLLGTNLNSATLQGADLREAKIQVSKDSEKSPDLRGTDLRGVDITNADVYGVTYDDNMKCFGIRAAGCHGDQLFVRHVLDLAYLDGFKIKNPNAYRWWKVSSNCGRSWHRLVLHCVGILYLFWTIFDLLKVRHPLVTSIMAFTSFGFVDTNAHATCELVLICIEAVLGYVMFGVLVSLIASNMARRSG